MIRAAHTPDVDMLLVILQRVLKVVSWTDWRRH